MYHRIKFQWDDENENDEYDDGDGNFYDDDHYNYVKTHKYHNL